MKGRLAKLAVLTVAIMMAITIPAIARTPMTEAKAVAAPKGFVDFCERHPGECRAQSQSADPVRLTPDRLAELQRVQTEINRTVSYRPDSYTFGKRDHWAYPFVYGDCEDFALQKKRELVALGWPRSALLLTIAQQPEGNLHLVLTVVTDVGDLVLDNMADGVVARRDLDYRWLIRQSRTDESAWVSLIDTSAGQNQKGEPDWRPATGN
ncbi:MAG: transglutaminase-like cysteine peptidase [Rhodospirillales bacterium]|nr:transglutaminase-like cysteine peptidase [Rhodospirillales bacterium]